ncbi:glycosyl hydrolase family 61-domain-containing protein [Aspergillus spectabilis]
MFFFLSILLGIISHVSAHGYVSSITVSGTTYPGFIVTRDPWEKHPDRIAWSTTATDTGFVEDVQSPDIICHEGAKPGAASATVAAGETVNLAWSEDWPADHYGPVINYLANCNGDCSTVDKTTLKFFKIDEAGLLEDGSWGTDKLVANGKSWDVTIPSNLKAGNYVLRHEIIALHSTFYAQNYPQCVNLEVTGGGEELPEGVPGIELYTRQDPGMHINIWAMDKAKGYNIPGPALYSNVMEDAPEDETTVVSGTTTTTTASTFVTSASPPPTDSTSQPPESTTYSPDPASTASESETESEIATACPADTEISSETAVETATTTPAAASTQVADALPATWRLQIQDTPYSCTRIEE